MLGLLKGIASGVASGIGAAFLGYLKSSKEESFELKKFCVTLGIGAIVGGVSSVSGMNYEEAYDYLASIGVITLSEYCLKIIWRKLIAPRIGK